MLGFLASAQATALIEIDIVAINEPEQCMRFGGCNRNAAKHTASSLQGFQQNIADFLATTIGRRFAAWQLKAVGQLRLAAQILRNTLIINNEDGAKNGGVASPAAFGFAHLVAHFLSVAVIFPELE